HETSDFHFAGAFVDIDDTNIAAERKSQVGWIIVRYGFQAGLHSLRMVCVRSQSDFLNRFCISGIAANEELARLPFEVVFPGFQQMRGDLTGLIANFSSCHRTCGAGSRSAAAGISSKSVWSRVGVAFFYQNVAGWNAQFLRDDLRVGRFMALSLRLGSEARDCFPRRMDSNLTGIEHLQPKNVEVFRGTRADNLGKAADSDSHQFAACTLFSLLFTKLGIADFFHRLR